MTLQIGQALGRGTRRSLSVSGIVLVVSLLFSQIGITGAANTVAANSLPPEAAAEAGGTGFSFPVSTAVGVAIGVVAMLVGIVVFLAAARLLSRDLSELGSVPMELLTHRFGRASLTAIAVSIILGIVIPIGFLFLIIPGIFLAISFQFAIYAVAVEDRGPIDALRRSWELASGNRWRLFGLGLIVFVITAIGGSIGSLVSFASPTAGAVVSLVVNAVLTIVAYGILADAFVQLRNGSAATTVGTGGATSTSAEPL